MKLPIFPSALVLFCVSPLACSNDASLGDDRQPVAAADDDVNEAEGTTSADDSSGTGNDDSSTSPTDGVGSNGSGGNSESALEASDTDDAASATPEADADDEVMPPEPSVEPEDSATTPGVVDGGADDASNVNPQIADAGSPTPPVDCEVTNTCTMDPSPSELVTEEHLATRYDPVRGCFELSREVAGTSEYDPENPRLCTAAASLGLSPTGECWGFHSGCQPDGFVPINPAAPNGVDHECTGAGSCPLEWACEPGVLPPELDRSCLVDDDCYAQLWAGPCGCSSSAFAFNKRDVAALGAYRDACVDESVCECPVPETLTDQGEVVSNLTQALAECNGGQCLTRRDPSYCAGAAECIATYGECVPVDAANCRGGSGDCEACP